MKKFVVLSLIALLVLAFGSMAFAQAKKEEPKLEIKMSGFIDAQTHWSTNVGPGNPAAGIFGPTATIPAAYRFGGNAYDKDIAYWESRARLKMDFIMGKEASGTIFFEADSTYWGDRAGGNAGTISERNTYGYWGGDRAALEIKNIFFDFAMPVIPIPTTVRVGLQTFAIRASQFLLTDGIGITAGFKVDPANISLIYAKAIEGDPKASDDVDVYGIHANAKVGAITVGGYGLYYNMNSYPLNVSQAITSVSGALIFPLTRLIAGTQRAEMWWLGLYADGKVGPVNFNYDFIYDRGKVESRFTPGARDLKFRGWYTRAKVDFPWEKFNFGVVGMYATGADAKKTDAMGTVGATAAYGAPYTATKVGSFVLPPASESGAAFGESVVLYSNWTDRGTSGYGLNINYNAMHRGGAGGTWFGKLYASYKATPWYKVTLQGLYIGDTTKNGNTFGNARKPTGVLRDDKTIGFEADLINEIQIWKSVSLNIAGGYLWAGDALDMWTGTVNDSPKNPWHISTSLKYTF